MTDPDEPMLRKDSLPEEADDGIEGRIRRLLDQQLFAVLCTQGEDQPYGSVIALTVDETLRTAVFATGRATRKYRLLSGNARVAFVVDDRDRHPGQIMSVQAVTVTGRAREVTAAGERSCWSELLLRKHPTLKSFVSSPTTAIVAIDIVRYLHVSRFQEVRQWVPPNPA